MQNSIVMEEFFKIMSPQVKTASDSKEDIEDTKVKSDDKSIIEKAHPESVYVAEARGDGGLVENEIETHKKIMDIIKKMPNGNLVGRYAAAIVDLVKEANKCDVDGKKEEADQMMHVAQKLLKEMEESFLK